MTTNTLARLLSVQPPVSPHFAEQSNTENDGQEQKRPSSSIGMRCMHHMNKIRPAVTTRQV